MGELEEKGARAREASYQLALLTTEQKNQGLLAMADALEAEMAAVLAANAQDMQRAKEKGQPQAFLDRLLLTEGRVRDMAEGIRAVAELSDPVGYVEEMWLNKDNLQIGKVAVPLGVIGMIYEARPNVTADAAALCLKSGNAVLLRGSGDAIQSNIKIAAVLSAAAEKAGIPAAGGGHQQRNSKRHAEAQCLFGCTHSPRRCRPDSQCGAECHCASD